MAVRAQSNAEVAGWVRDAQGQALPGANVIVYDGAHNIIAFGSSSVDGSYKVNFDTATAQRIAASFIGYTTVELSLDTLLLGQSRANLSFSLLEDVNLLGEVIVRQENVRQDTVGLDLKNLNLTDNSKLEEILKKSVGFQLAEGGAILYRGKNIERIMVNGRETFVHQNSLALQSIENRMIEEMSIINNHKNKFSLNFDEAEETVLNIKTKQEFKDIVTGSLLVGYGLPNKFDTQLRGFYFSENVNAFVSSNNNNIGKNLVELRDLAAIFNSQQSLSDFQLYSLSNAFRINANRLKDFQSTSNLTLRKENDKFRVSAVIYSVNPNTLSSVITKNSTLSNQPLLNSSELTSARTTSFFSAIDLDYRLSSNNIIKFQSRTDKIWDSGSRNAQNDVFVSNVYNSVLYDYLSNTTSSQNDLFYNSKLSKKLLYNASVSTYVERTKVSNTILDKELATYLYDQHIKLDTETILLSNSLSYNMSRHLLPVLGVVVGTSKQKITDLNPVEHDVSRRVTDVTFSALTTGRSLSAKLAYSASLKVNKYILGNRQGVFMPFAVSAEYENRLSRLSFSSERKRILNPLSSAITTNRLYNRIIKGSKELPQAISFSTISKVDYTYTNVFQGRAWGVSLRLEDFNNRLSQSLLEVTDRGINTFRLFETPKAYESQATLRGSKTIFKYLYPTKLDGEVSYINNNFPTILSNAQVDVRTKRVEVGVLLETISKHVLNFEASNRNSVSTTRVGSTDLRTTSFDNTLSILCSKSIFESKLSFVYNMSILLGQQYQRKNINCQANLNLKKITLGLEGRNIGDLIGLFNNTAYDSRLFVNDGISSTYIMDRALNYMVASVKYTF
ncbi:carboxypeptidase-like regulatory domain-containing protein [Hymenobacter arizonensis]|uniref:Carboxypeptidase regulatory-like domain-containing protein n=1 Tax=Hymenobacter arizonensis TaxID=1227077 RepID=A0A1I6BFD2_HYMAR|nr:carboxypeptidase-like regulatory domain-containing protein [Hymenobacter arizonensis]SFQ79660.1 Carboxypeptidase regulatory-like domain-containing protein [Hymenobacter arizonensis]